MQELHEACDCLKNNHTQNDEIKKCANTRLVDGVGFLFVRLRWLKCFGFQVII
jgi:hypothetical protein